MQVVIVEPGSVHTELGSTAAVAMGQAADRGPYGDFKDGVDGLLDGPRLLERTEGLGPARGGGNG